MNKIFRFIVLLIILTLIVGIGYKIYNTSPFWLNGQETVSHDAVVDEIRLMGKVQLVQMNIRDVVEYKVERNMFLPDSKVLIIVAGEIGACVDLQKIQDSDIERKGETIEINLPLPEVCYVKVDHSRSKIYDKKSYYFLDNDAELIDKAYKEAEVFLNKPQTQTQAISEALKNAPVILEPVFRKITGKNVVLKFEKTPFLD